MTENLLAEQLKQRLIGKKLVKESDFANLNDHQIVESYIVCSCCGERQMDDFKLSKIVSIAVNAEDFINLLDQDGKLP